MKEMEFSLDLRLELHELLEDIKRQKQERILVRHEYRCYQLLIHSYPYQQNGFNHYLLI